MDFSKMRIDPAGHDPLWEHPALTDLKPPETWEGSEKEFSVLIGLALCYTDRQSPLFDIRDFDFRLKEAKRIFHLKTSGPAYAAIRSRSPLWRGLVHTLFIINNDHDYYDWYAQKMNLAYIQEFLAQPINALDPEKSMNARRQITKDVGEFKRRLKELEADLFNDEYLMEDVIKEAMKDELEGWAEKYALVPDYFDEPENE